MLILAALVKPDALEPANRGWNELGLVLHKITNPLFLGAMYAVAIIPTGLLMRVFGADPMGLRRQRKRHLLDHASARPDRPRSRWKNRFEAPMSFLKDLAAFMLARKKFWLLPVMILMVLFGGLIVLTKGSVVAPFIYTLF